MQLIDNNQQRRFQRIYYNKTKNIEFENDFLLLVYFENEQYYDDELYDETFQEIVYSIVLVEIE